MTNERNIRRFGLGVVAFAALAELLIVLCYARGVLVVEHYLSPMVFAFAGMTMLSGAYQKKPALWLGAAFCLWYVLSRMLMGELYLKYSYPYLCNLCAAYLLALPMAHCTKDEKQSGMKLFSWIYFAGFGAVAWLSLLPAVQGEVMRLPWFDVDIGLQAVDRRLTIGLHPNGSGVMLLISLMMGVWLLCKHRKRWLLLPALVLMAGMYAAIGFTVSRTVMIQTGCFLGALAALALLRLLPWNRLWKKLLVAAPVAMVIVIVVFLSFGWITTGAEKLNESMNASAEEVFPGVTGLDYSDYYLYPEYPDMSSLYAQDGLVADRDLIEDLTTLTGRTAIWRGIGQLVKDQPRVLLTGMLNSDIISVLNRYTAHTHAHNSILHTLCNMGLPAMLIAVYFTLRAAWCALRLIFGKNAKFSDQILAVMLLVWLLGSLTESSLFVESFTPCNIPFFLTLGYALEAEKTLSK